MLRYALAGALALTACSPDTSLAPPTAHVLAADGDDVDLYFRPVPLADGQAVTAEAGALRLRSVAGPDAHRVAMDAGGRAIRAVSGLLDGAVQLTALPSPDGGETSVGPTSVHRRLRCGDDGCVEVVEYDYDLHGVGGQGTAAWRTPDGRSATIDRLRFELDAAPTAGRVRVRTPEPAVRVTPAR